ncbi:MAG: 3-oxoacyl-ACP reductase FabG [Propionicimonas sp.]|uniref:3-oxoacyl-ACP reductase FabG n=1 Tax=Propionicimonas sp. TaxID=1955623 RepID=UPI003D0ED6DA
MTETSTSAVARSVVVTGGNRGIGRAIVEKFLAGGHRVASFDMGGEPPEGVLGVTCNVTDSEQVDAAFKAAEEANGPVEVLIANAGITKDTLILRMSDADWDAVINVNLTGAFRVAKRAAKSMIRGKWGRIVFTGSVVGLYGSAGQVNYSSSKAALVGMARSLTRELGSRGVTANVVAPGFIETDMTAVLPEDVIARYLASIPAARLGQPSEVASAVAFLASEEAGFISGAVIPVDGGLGMGH